MATHPRIAPRRGARATTWWGKAWVRAVEESAYGERDLVRGRTLARSGLVGGITVEPGRFLAAVEEGDDAFTVTGSVPMLGPRSVMRSPRRWRPSRDGSARCWPATCPTAWSSTPR